MQLQSSAWCKSEENSSEINFPHNFCASYDGLRLKLDAVINSQFRIIHGTYDMWLSSFDWIGLATDVRGDLFAMKFLQSLRHWITLSENDKLSDQNYIRLISTRTVSSMESNTWTAHPCLRHERLVLPLTNRPCKTDQRWSKQKA